MIFAMLLLCLQENINIWAKTQSIEWYWNQSKTNMKLKYLAQRQRIKQTEIAEMHFMVATKFVPTIKYDVLVVTGDSGIYEHCLSIYASQIKVNFH